MKPRNSQPEVSVKVNFLAGTSPKQVKLDLGYLCRKAGINYRKVFKDLAFDFSPSAPFSNSEENEDSLHSIDNDEFIQATFTKSSNEMKEAELEGYFWVADADFHLNPGTMKDTLGAGGKPANGFIISQSNSKHISPRLKKLMQAARDQALQMEKAKDGQKSFGITRVTIDITISTVGAMGTGSLQWLIMYGIPDSVHEADIEPKVSAHLILRGNFDTDNSAKATANEAITLKFIQALASGKYIHPVTGFRAPIPFESVYLYSNTNQHGNMTSFRQLLAHQAHAEFFRWCTNAGNKMHERGCDLPTITYNKYGDPLCGRTVGVALITRDSSRLIKHSTCMSTALFCRKVLTEPADSENIALNAIGFARAMKLVEYEEDNQLSSELIVSKEMGNENIIHQARESLMDRVSDTRGYTRASQLDEAIQNILVNEIPGAYEPAMQKQAKEKTAFICEELEKVIEQKIESFSGLYKTYHLLSNLKDLLNNSQNTLQEKISQIQENFLVPHQMVLADCSEQVQLLRQRNPLIRSFSFMLTRRINSDLMQSGIAAISHQLEVSCCQIAINEILMPLMNFIEKKLGWIASALRKLENISDHCGKIAYQLAKDDTTLINPNGYELTTDEYLNQSFLNYVRTCGGEDIFCKLIYDNFIKSCGSAKVLTETPQIELLEMFSMIISPMFQQSVSSTNVWDEFVRIYPNPHIQKEMVTQLILHSEGRVRTEDGINSNVHWVKTANVPHPSLVEPFRRLLESLDTKQGKWEVVVNDDIDTISIGQLRGSISLSPFIQRLGIPDNEAGWKLLCEHAVDVVSALLVPVNPNDRQLRRVLVKAFAANLVTNEDGLFYLQRIDEEPLCLGRDFSSAKDILRMKWPDLVFTESVYARNLVIDENKVLNRMKKLSEDIDDQHALLINAESVEDCLKQTMVMLPKLRRMRTAALRNSQI